MFKTGALIFCLFILKASDALAAQFIAKVNRVVDGDTVVVTTGEGKSVRIRMSDIDAPEKDQPWGPEATQALNVLIRDKTVLVIAVDTDRYGRVVATLFEADKNINQAMVEQGHAWVYRGYLRDSSLLNLESSARSQQIGLWHNASAIEPRIWRRSRNQATNQGDLAVDTQGFVKKSRSNICHVNESKYYARVKHFQRFETLNDCLAAGGRLPRG
jgi:endonuclease YncB( thermonuclease family)